MADKNANQNQNLQVPMPNSSLTFGTMKQGVLKNSLALNREYLEDKKIKNEILDEIIKNANKSNIMKSQDFGTRIPKGESFILCSNNDGKKVEMGLFRQNIGLLGMMMGVFARNAPFNCFSKAIKWRKSTSSPQQNVRMPVEGRKMSKSFFPEPTPSNPNTKH